MPVNPQDTIGRILKGYLVPGKTYPHPLPPELRQWYCYTIDGGHSIMIAVKTHYSPDKGVDEFLVPAPVKTVLRGYERKDGYILVDLPYSAKIGLVVPECDEEF